MRNLTLAVLAAAAIVLNISAVAPNLSPKPPNTPTKIEEYILRFKDLAMFQQLTTNIPASIKLGQAVYESQAGESELAMNANNHFGLKCKGCSESNSYLKKDDEFNKKGELVYSKFQRFPTAEASFFAHSQRLTTDGRYRTLFNNERTDYRAWAHGLRACGYATDKRYAEKLIAIIEKYGLHRFDKPSLLSLSEVAQEETPQYAAEQTAVNVPYDSDPNVPTTRYKVQEVEQEGAVELDNRKPINANSEGKKVENRYRTESEFTSNEGEQMHFTLYEVTLEEENENIKPEHVSPKNVPQKQKAVISKPVQRKKIVRTQK
jgi:Mannosyl-glycoprotein endo-beta-N-acetylglucosaminidase